MKKFDVWLILEGKENENADDLLEWLQDQSRVISVELVRERDEKQK